MYEARDYQLQAIQDLRRCVSGGGRSPVLVMPTGSGKTLVASILVRSAIQKGKHALFLAPRRELVYQTSDKLSALGVDHGIMMAGESATMMPSVQVASVPTVYRRCFKNGDPIQSGLYSKGMPLPPADVIVVDEAHTNMSNMARKILDAYPRAVKIGMTATPARSDGRGLGELYDQIVMGPSVAELTEQGYLVPARYFGAEKADLSQVRMKGGDYHEQDLGKAMTEPKLIGDVVENWLRIAPNRQTVVFAVNRAHAYALHQEFQRVGVASDYLDGETPHDERASILRALEDGSIRVLCSVDVLSYGWDCPVASCAVIARPTKSVARYLQVAGRVLRPYEGKDDCIIIDHGGVVEDLGFVDDDQPWSLDGKEKIQDRKESRERKEPKPIECHSCGMVIKPAHNCPGCGADLSFKKAKAIEAHEAELVEIERKERSKAKRTYTKEQKADWFAQLKRHAQHKGYKIGWAVHAYKEKFDCLPWPVYDTPARPVGEEVMGFIKHLQIKKAKQRKKAA